MIFWIFLWKVVLISGVLAFAALAVWITIGGYRDIKRLFERIEKSHHEQ